VFASVVPVVMQNCTHAAPPLNVPFFPFSTLSIVNELVWNAPLHEMRLRWLSHHAEAVLLEPSFINFVAETPDRVSFAETQM
jgi:hypothetical protein